MAHGLYIDGLSTTIRGKTILDGITMHLEPGSFYMLLGENGAGKTTLFRCLLGLTSHSGTARFVGAGSSDTASRADFAPVLDLSTLYGSWSVKANINFHLNASHGHEHASIRQIVPASIMRQRAGHLSTGQRKMVMVAIALASEAPVLLLDEFANGLDFTHRGQIREYLSEVVRQGRIIVATGYELDAFEGLPSHVGALQNGKIIDLTAAYLESGQLKKAYEPYSP